MLTVESLKEFGADTEEGVRRCMGNADFYLRLVKMMPADKNFPKLYSSLESGDLEGAFQAAHALKGSLGNLSITPLYEIVNDLTEELRPRKAFDWSAKVAELKKRGEEFEKLCRD